MKAAFGKKRRGEGRATADMEELFRQYGAMVQGYLTRLSGNVELARELTQETFYQAEKHVERFDGKSAAWSRVAYYRARQMLREAMEENADEREEK